MKIRTDTNENIVITQFELSKLYSNINTVYYTLFDKLELTDKLKLEEALDDIKAIRNKE